MSENIEALCLICQTDNCLEFIDIFSQVGIKLNISQIILKHFGMQVNEYQQQNNEVHQQSSIQHKLFICTECWSITDSFHKLYERVQLFSVVLLNENDEDDYTKSVKKEEHQCDDSNTIVDCGNDNSFSGIKDEPLNAMETVIFADKVIIGDDGVSKDTDKEDDDFNDENNIINENNVDDKDTNNSKSNEIYIKPKRRKYSKKLNLTKSLVKRNTKSAEDIERENQQIRDFFKMSCEICNENFHTFSDATDHYLHQHNQTGYLVCCKKKFFRRGLISDHISRHLNPNAFKCTQCNKIYVDKFALRNHMDQHAPIDKREYKCDICTSSFTKFFKLSQHIRVTHCTSTDKKFQCPECDKSFIIKSKLSSHIRGVHEFAYAHICHICAKTFKSKQIYELHQRDHSNVKIPKLQCKICGAWLKHEHSLRNHMARHSDSTATCEICNKVTSNRQALGNHMRYVHSERTHQCSMCEKAFKKAIGLKEHMASHTGEDLYTCSFCPKTFKSSANMHSHRKKVHPIEWQTDKIKRQKT